MKINGVENGKEYEVSGIITAPVSEDGLTDAIIAFVESKGWTFGGSVAPYKEKKKKKK